MPTSSRRSPTGRSSRIRRLAPEVGQGGGGVDQAVRGIEAEREHWIRVLRRFTHDVRTPLSVVKTNVGFLRESGAVADDEGTEVLDDVDVGVERMVKLLDELSESASLDVARVRLDPKPIPVDALVQRIEARVAALVRDRPVRVGVRSGQAAPTSVECNPLLLDRVLDQLLGTAAKYTERGQIGVEVDGSDEHLCIEIADTGSGVEATERTTAGSQQPPPREWNGVRVGRGPRGGGPVARAHRGPSRRDQRPRVRDDVPAVHSPALERAHRASRSRE